MRADQILVERGLAASRSQAQRLIASGMRWRVDGEIGAAWRAVGKNGDELPAEAEVELLDTAEARYVSRGGLKLEAALGACGIEVAGKRCLDVGQSTGGFTDCLLQHGAAQVVGVDVGQGQLHPRLRADPRVICLEKVNARSLSAVDLMPGDCQVDAGGPFQIITADLSFISLTLVLAALVPFVAIDGDMLMLVKPQFELQPGQVGKGGVVRDAALYEVVERRLRDCCAALSLRVLGWHESAVRGGDGNREFFIHVRAIT